MAAVNVSIGQTANDGRPIFHGRVRGETITSSGTAASGSLTAGPKDVARIDCASALRVTADGTTASASNGLYVPAGVSVDIGMDSGKTLSVIDA